MRTQLQNILQSLHADTDGIYGNLTSISQDQSVEIALREHVAAAHYENYLESVSTSHSITVMDNEVDRFLAKIPHDGLILDVGGCWGWHWRRLAQTRPDVGVLIIDFVRSNLVHAKNVLGELVGHQVALMHADATALPFTINSASEGFDGVWTVQTFQHIPAFEKAVSEAHRVLKKGGVFANYSLNIQPPLRRLYQLLGRNYVVNGSMNGQFWLARASKEQMECIKMIFDSAVAERWTEILFSPELHFPSPGRNGSLLGKLDVVLSNNVGFLGWLARQKSFHCGKL